MSNKSFLHSTTNASIWAKEFMDTIIEHDIDVDEDFMLGWFANAIMAGYDSCRNRPISGELTEKQVMAFANPIEYTEGTVIKGLQVDE